jgi:hypothetical protein
VTSWHNKYFSGFSKKNSREACWLLVGVLTFPGLCLPCLHVDGSSHLYSVCHIFTFRIDASEEDGSLGRLVNDDHIAPNSKMKKLVVVSGYWTVLAGRPRTQACHDWLANAMRGRGLSVHG